MLTSCARILAVAAAVFTLIGEVRAQEEDAAARMAETIVRVCVAGMRSGEPITLEQLDDQFVFDEVERGVTWLRQARGQPWVRLSINGSRPGSCSASFSDSARSSIRAAQQLASELRGVPGMRGGALVPGMRDAFTFDEVAHPFDHERHPYIAYLPVGGNQIFFFVPAAEPTEP
jgi:hypothetical protein